MNLAGTKCAGNRPTYSPEMREGRTFGFTVCVSAALHEFPTLHFASLCIALVRKIEAYRAALSGVVLCPDNSARFLDDSLTY